MKQDKLVVVAPPCQYFISYTKPLKLLQAKSVQILKASSPSLPPLSNQADGGFFCIFSFFRFFRFFSFFVLVQRHAITTGGEPGVLPKGVPVA